MSAWGGELGFLVGAGEGILDRCVDMRLYSALWLNSPWELFELMSLNHHQGVQVLLISTLYEEKANEHTNTEYLSTDPPFCAFFPLLMVPAVWHQYLTVKQGS